VLARATCVAALAAGSARRGWATVAPDSLIACRATVAGDGRSSDCAALVGADTRAVSAVASAWGSAAGVAVRLGTDWLDRATCAAASPWGRRVAGWSTDSTGCLGSGVGAGCRWEDCGSTESGRSTDDCEASRSTAPCCGWVGAGCATERFDAALGVSTGSGGNTSGRCVLRWR
jgi:hypothetical protein